jgi:FeS assembly SUF system regulator
MIRLTNFADYAVVVMTAAARSPERRFSAAEIAVETGIPAPTAAKVAGVLTRAGLLESARGAAGGVRLGRVPASISIADIVEAVDGPIAIAQCLHENGQDCALEVGCAVRPHWPLVNRRVRAALADVSLADIVAAPRAATVQKEIA